MTFDPFHKWLGIPTDKRPITYYDLLGLQFGERDPIAIRSAIEQRRAFVSQQRGQGQDQYVQKLLSQIDKATTTLLSEETKFRYDKEIAHLKPDQSKSKRRRSYVIPRVVETRIERIYGEGSGIVGDLFGIVSIIFCAFALMAILSFTLRSYQSSKEDRDPEALTWLEQLSMDSKSKNDGTDDASLTSKVVELQGKITKWRENETKLKTLNQSMERDRLKLLGQLDSLSSNNNPDEVEKKKTKLLQDELKDILRKSAAYKTKCSDYELAILKSSSTLRSIERQMAAQDAGVTDAELTQLTRTMLELDESLAKQDAGMEVVDTVNDTIAKQLAEYRNTKQKSGPLTDAKNQGLGGESSSSAEPIDAPAASREQSAFEAKYNNPRTETKSLLLGNILSQWQAVKKNDDISNWLVESGVLRLSRIGPSIRTKEVYRDFELHLEFKLPAENNTGVFLRGRYEVQLLDSLYRSAKGEPAPPISSSGAIYGQHAPSKEVYKGPNQWNTLDVRLIGDNVTIVMNSVTIIESKTLSKVTAGALDENESDPGPIVLQAHGTAGQEFRNISIKPVATNNQTETEKAIPQSGSSNRPSIDGNSPNGGRTDSTQWQTMFDGTTLNGWKVGGDQSAWRVENGTIVCSGERSHLYYVAGGSFKNFHLKCDAKCFSGSNSGIYFHTRFKDQGYPQFGFECQIASNGNGDRRKTGSLYGLVDVINASVQDGKWFMLEMIVKGKRIEIQVNGKVVVDYKEPADQQLASTEFERLIGEGIFALQSNSPNSKTHFRDLRVKRLED